MFDADLDLLWLLVKQSFVVTKVIEAVNLKAVHRLHYVTKFCNIFEVGQVWWGSNFIVKHICSSHATVVFKVWVFAILEKPFVNQPHDVDGFLTCEEKPKDL